MACEATPFSGKGKKKNIGDDFPELRAWRAMLKPLFGIYRPLWQQSVQLQPELL